MSKRNKVQDQEFEEIQNQQKQEEPVIDKGELQAYYNSAYLAERDRLNAMFGKIDTFDAPERVIYKDVDLSKYVSIEKYNKKKRCCVALGILFGLALVAAVVFALLYFKVI